MTKTFSLACIGATALLFGFGCSAGVKANPVGTAGTTGQGTAGSSGGGTTGNGGTGTGGTLPGFDASIDLGGGDVRVDGVCSATMTAAEPVPLDLYVLMDSSLSMNESTATGTNTTKWGDVRTAMKAFFESSSSAGLGVGLKYFPGVQSGAPATCSGDGADPACGNYGPCDRRKTCVTTSNFTTSVSPLCVSASTCGTLTCSLIKDCGGGNYCAEGPTATTNKCASNCGDFAGYCHLRDRCDAAYYATPDVAVGRLDGTSGGQAAMLNTSLTGHSPAGYTPTGPALAGALMFARSRIGSMPTHRVAIVLVTDGLPGGFLGSAGTGFPPAECMPNSITAQGSDPGIAPLLSGTMGATGAPPINTFVIGVFGKDNKAAAQPILDMLAKAGQNSNTATAVIVDTSQDVAAALQSALKSVQSKAIACDYQLPTTGVDFKKVNVSFTSGGGSDTAIGHAPIDGTDGSGCDQRGGWYYDKDPASGTPTKITACPASCSMFQTDLNGHVNVILGCPTIDVD